jgi:hypothetical protein
MRFSTLATALTTASLASARLIGIAAPSTLAPNSTFELTLLSEGYIQAVADVAVAWGFDRLPGYAGSLGSYTDSAYVLFPVSSEEVSADDVSRYLGPEKSNQGQDNVTISATVPAELAQEYYFGKEVLLNAAVYSLYGASHGPSVTGFNVTVMIGNTTSSDVVSSEGQAWVGDSTA